MGTYVLMTKLSPEITTQMADRAELGRAWLDRVKLKCPSGVSNSRERSSEVLVIVYNLHIQEPE